MISDRDILGAVKEWIIGKFGNVNNTSDADKPISTAQQEEFDKKVNKDDIMQGATTTTAGKAGLVPAPAREIQMRFLNPTGHGERESTGLWERLLLVVGIEFFLKRQMQLLVRVTALCLQFREDIQITLQKTFASCVLRDTILIIGTGIP